MKVEKFKVLLYLKKSGLDRSGKAPIMGHHREPHDGTVRLQAVMHSRTVEPTRKPSFSRHTSSDRSLRC